MNTLTIEEKEREEIEIERKVWSTCFLCEEEYSTPTNKQQQQQQQQQQQEKEGEKVGGKEVEGNIVMNKECLHSYCKECIEQSFASTGSLLLCPICHSSLSTPLSSLPINFTLCYWQSLSPPLPSFTLPLIPLLADEEEKKLCEDCEENKAEVHCSDCKISVCNSCSDSIHSRRVMKNHSISPITSSLSALKKSSLLPTTSPIIQFYQCERHNNEEKKLYCMTCNECVCVDCIGDFHNNHTIKSVIKRVEDIKEEWKKGVEEISNDIINNQLKEVNFQSEKLSKEIDQVNEEIKRLEDTLVNLIDKKERMMTDLNRMNESKEKINQSTSFLLFFLQSLPPLPLSSFLSSSSSINNNNNNNIIEMKEENKEEKRRRRIRDFFEKENLISLYSSLLPSSLSSSSSLLSQSIIIHNKNGRKIYSEEEKEKRNKMIFSNQLIQNQNLLSHFGSKGSDPFTHFNNPFYITYNDKLNIIAVSDYSNGRVKIMDKKGALIRCFPFQEPTGIAIIPSLSLLAVSSNSKHVIEIFDISPLLPSIHNNNKNDPLNNNKWEEGVPLLYTIGKGRGGIEDHFHFNSPRGIGYSEGKGILAISDYFNKRIEIYKIRRDGYEHHSFISLPINPIHIAISSPADLILVSNGSKVMIYKAEEEEEEGKKRGWFEVGEMRPPPSLQPPLTSPTGMAIHSPLNYCVICDGGNNRILFFNITTRDLICSYQPTLPPPLPPSSSPYYFQTAYGISIDEEADLISVSDTTSHSISLFLSPIF